MRNLYDINKWLIIITLLLYFTFWGGILAQTVLGASQILMSLYILSHFSKLNKSTRILMVGYILITLATITIFRIIGENGNDSLVSMFLFMIVSMLLGFFHLYITYKISKL